VIQEINAMKRLVSLAESNHYALYNAYAFLQHCTSIPSLLLSSVSSAAQVEETAAQSRDVLRALVSFVKLQTDGEATAQLNPEVLMRLREAVSTFPSPATVDLLLLDTEPVSATSHA